MKTLKTISISVLISISISFAMNSMADGFECEQYAISFKQTNPAFELVVSGRFSGTSDAPNSIALPKYLSCQLKKTWDRSFKRYQGDPDNVSLSDLKNDMQAFGAFTHANLFMGMRGFESKRFPYVPIEEGGILVKNTRHQLAFRPGKGELPGAFRTNFEDVQPGEDILLLTHTHPLSHLKSLSNPKLNYIPFSLADFLILTKRYDVRSGNSRGDFNSVLVVTGNERVTTDKNANTENVYIIMVSAPISLIKKLQNSEQYRTEVEQKIEQLWQQNCDAWCYQKDNIVAQSYALEIALVHAARAFGIAVYKGKLGSELIKQGYE